MDVFVARQPIFDRNRELYGYELLFRSSAARNAFDSTEASVATTQLIANSLLAIGLEPLLCGKKAFINFDRRLLLGGLHSVLPPENLIIEILETVEPDADVLTACRDLARQGYTLALDDFVSQPKFEPLARLTKLIKVDLLATSHAEAERILRQYRPARIALLAEKVETRAEFDWALAAGYDYFQGYFFARPEIVRGQRIPASKMTCLRLLSEVQSPEPDFSSLESLICGDVSLTYSLLLYVNSARFARVGEIRAVGQGMAVLGQQGMRHWAVLAALPMLAKDKPGELVTLSLVRARFCQRIAALAGLPPQNPAFLMGLFSLLDSLIDVPLAEALLRVHAADEITQALTADAAHCGSRYAQIYHIACRYEAGEWDDAALMASVCGIRPASLAEAYTESAIWAQRALQAASRQKYLRRSPRRAVTGEVSLRYQPDGEPLRGITAIVTNASAGGLQLRATAPIAPGTCVSCRDVHSRTGGRATVKYCNFANGRYLIGLEFAAGTGPV